MSLSRTQSVVRSGNADDFTTTTDFGEELSTSRVARWKVIVGPEWSSGCF